MDVAEQFYVDYNLHLSILHVQQKAWAGFKMQNIRQESSMPSHIMTVMLL